MCYRAAEGIVLLLKLTLSRIVTSLPDGKTINRRTHEKSIENSLSTDTRQTHPENNKFSLSAVAKYLP